MKTLYLLVKKLGDLFGFGAAVLVGLVFSVLIQALLSPPAHSSTHPREEFNLLSEVKPGAPGRGR